MPKPTWTRNRVIRVPDNLWNAAKRVAKDRRETITAVIIRALYEYVRSHPGGEAWLRDADGGSDES